MEPQLRFPADFFCEVARRSSSVTRQLVGQTVLGKFSNFLDKDMGPAAELGHRIIKARVAPSPDKVTPSTPLVEYPNTFRHTVEDFPTRPITRVSPDGPSISDSLADRISTALAERWLPQYVRGRRPNDKPITPSEWVMGVPSGNPGTPLYAVPANIKWISRLEAVYPGKNAEFGGWIFHDPRPADGFSGMRVISAMMRGLEGTGSPTANHILRHQAEVAYHDFRVGFLISRLFAEALNQYVAAINKGDPAEIAHRQAVAESWQWLPDLAPGHPPHYFTNYNPVARWQQIVSVGLRSPLHILELREIAAKAGVALLIY